MIVQQDSYWYFMMFCGSNAGKVLLDRLLLLSLLRCLLADSLFVDFLSQLLVFLVTFFLSYSLEEAFTLTELFDLSVDFLGRSGGEQLDRFKHALHVEWYREFLFSFHLLFLLIFLFMLLLGLLIFF